MTSETLFEETWISLHQGYSMPNTNAFQPVVHEKIYDSYAGWSFYTPVRATQARNVEG